MAKQKMKKSNVKKRSERSIAYEKEQQEKAAELEAQKEKRKVMTRNMGNSMICMYGFCIAILSWIFDYMGIFAILSIVLCVIGLHKADRKNHARDYWCDRIGLVLAIIRLMTEYLVPLLAR